MNRYGRSWFFGLACMLLFLFSMGSTIPINGSEQGSGSIDTIDDTEKDALKEKVLSLSSSYFIQNIGQIESDEVLFYSGGGDVYFTPTGVIYRFREKEPIYDKETDRIDPKHDVPDSYHERGVVLKYTFLGSNPVTPEGRDRCSWNTNYFKGSDPNKWYTEVHNYREIWYRDLWNEIDLVYRQNEKGMKYDLIMRQGADPDDIRIQIEGQDFIKVSERGNLVIGTTYWDIIDSGLYAYYNEDIRAEVGCAFSLIRDNIYSFVLSDNKISKEIVIDPILSYSTFVGSSSYDHGFGIALDQSGNAYITGSTSDGTTDYPTTLGAYDTSHSGVVDAFVTKLNSAGSSLIYSTFIGGSRGDSGIGIAIDVSGNAYITGNTEESVTLYPTTAGAYDTTHNHNIDVFVTKLNSAGSSLLYSTFLGGQAPDFAHGIEVDSSGNAYIMGMTQPDSFKEYPTTSGAYDTSHNGKYDVFVTKLNSAGSSLLYSTFIGGSSFDYGEGITIDSSGNAYIIGYTPEATTMYPTTAGAYDTTFNGINDVFVTKLSSTGSSLLYSTLIGGVQGGDEGYDIAVDSSGNAYITGFAGVDYPTTAGAYDTTHNGGGDVFVTKLNPAGSSLLYSSFIGGSGWDMGRAITIDSSGNTYITGYTYNSTNNYPTTSSAYDTIHMGYIDVFVTKLNSAGSSLFYSTLIGGSDSDYGYGITLDSNGNAYINGFTKDSIMDYPTTASAYDTTHNGLNDTFVTKIDVTPPVFGSDNSIVAVTTGDRFTFDIEVTDNNGVSSVFVEYWFGSGPIIKSSMFGSDHYTFTITIPVNSTDEMNYIFYANDIFDNWNRTEERIVPIIDNDLPYFGSDPFPTSVGTGDILLWPIHAYDNIGIYTVHFEHWFGDGLHDNATLGGQGNCLIEQAIPEGSIDPLHYIISAADMSGNWASIQGTIVVEDTLPPVIAPIPDIIVDEDRPITFNISGCYDNIGILNWSWSVMWGDIGGEVSYYGEDLIKTITFLQPGYYSIWLNATDAAGNWKVGLFCNNVTVRDITPPHIENMTFSIGEDAPIGTIYAEAEDNVGIVNWTWAFQDQGVNRLLYGRSLLYSFKIPGTYNITVLVRDTAGNSASGWILLTVTDWVKPVVDAGSNQTVDEDVQVTLEGNGTDDGGIVNWTWRFKDGYDRTLYGKIVTYTFAEPGIYTVILQVKDTAGNSMNDSLTITVREVITDDGGGDDSEEDGSFLWIIIALVILSVIIVSIVLFFVLRKKKPLEIIIDRSEEFVIPPEPPTPEPTSVEPTSDVSVSTSEPTEPTPQPPVMDEAPLEKEVDGKPTEDTVMNPDHLEDLGSAL